VFTSEQAGGALIVAADPTLGELVQEETAGLVERLGGDDFAAEIAEVSEPFAEVKRELFVQLLAELLGQRGRVSCGRDGDLQVAAADNRREVEVAERRVVDGVAKDALLCSLGENGAVNRRVVGGGDDEEGSSEVAFFIVTLEEGQFACGGLLADGLAGLRCDDRDSGVSGAEGGDLRLS
jgi:hypothetical protein